MRHLSLFLKNYTLHLYNYMLGITSITILGITSLQYYNARYCEPRVDDIYNARYCEPRVDDIMIGVGLSTICWYEFLA